MAVCTFHSFEDERLEALVSLNLLDTPESESFDRITRLASQLFQTPIAAVSLTDRHRQWFKSHVGTEGREIPRQGAPCAEVTRTAGVLIVPDLLLDSRFIESVLAQSGIRFYAGAPLITREGYVLGALCVLDRTVRTISEKERASLQDFAAMVMSQIELQHNFGRIDPVSGLANRNQLLEDLEDAARLNSGGPCVAVLMDLVDPQSLSEMTSVLGTGCAEDLVKAASRIVKESLGRKILIYQVSATSLAVFLNQETEHSWWPVVQTLIEKFRNPFSCAGVPITTDIAFGISPFRRGDVPAQEVLRTAVCAAQDSRQAGLEYAVYSPANDQANHRRFALLTEIRTALEDQGQLSLVYQPRVDLRTGVCTSAEALLRWQHPTLGSVSPGEFIPLLEQTTFVHPLTQWVLTKACQQLLAWQRAGIDMRISVNITARNLEEQDFAQGLNHFFQQQGIRADALELEFTEGAFIRHRARVLHQLEQLRALGVTLAIDDFGTGYSTFSYLHKLPATILKLDQSFLTSLSESTKDQSLVRSIIAMAHEIGYRVVAEGVETLEIYSFLRDCQCDEVQGYYIARPLLVEDFEHFLQQRRDQQMRSTMSVLQQASAPLLRA